MSCYWDESPWWPCQGTCPWESSGLRSQTADFSPSQHLLLQTYFIFNHFSLMLFLTYFFQELKCLQLVISCYPGTSQGHSFFLPGECKIKCLIRGSPAICTVCTYFCARNPDKTSQQWLFYSLLWFSMLADSAGCSSAVREWPGLSHVEAELRQDGGPLWLSASWSPATIEEKSYSGTVSGTEGQVFPRTCMMAMDFAVGEQIRVSLGKWGFIARKQGGGCG